MNTQPGAGSEGAHGASVDMTPDAWLRAQMPSSGLSSSAHTLLNYLLTNISEAVYARAAELASGAGVSLSSVTRLAQQLGFDGWPDLQRKLRARYLSSLSMVDVTAVHGVTDTPFQSAVRRDISSLTQAAQDLDERAILRIAELLLHATQIHVAAMGSFAAVGQAFSHNLLLAGYPAHGLLDRDAHLANTVARLGPSDVLVVCSYWRHYRVVVGAAIAAHRRGAKVILISDYLPQALAPIAEEVLLIPAEGTSFFASLTVPMAVQQGIMATLARIDPEHTRRQLEVSEELWGELGLLMDPLEG